MTFNHDSKSMDPQEIIRRANTEDDTFHKIHFPDGAILNGRVDMSKYLKFYNIPLDLSGKTVLDVGCSTGFFSFEFYRRGASKVVAIHEDPIEIQMVQEAANKLMKTNV